MNREQVESATVTIESERGKGRAFLVPGPFLITATHCVNFNVDGSMPLGDYYLQWVETITGERFQVSPVFIDPVNDIAVFSAPDNQEFPHDDAAFSQFADSREAFTLAMHDGTADIHVFTHEGRHVNGTGEVFKVFWKVPPVVFVTFNDAVNCGTSGSPVLNSRNEAVAVISATSVGRNDGAQPIILNCLPKFLLHAIEAATLADTETMTRSIDAAIEAYENATGSWTGWDWAQSFPCGYDDDGNQDSVVWNCRSDIDSRFEASDKATEYADECEGAAQSAELSAAEAVEFLKSGDYDRALRLAEAACDAESTFRDCSTWRPFLLAVDSLQAGDDE